MTCLGQQREEVRPGDSSAGLKSDLSVAGAVVGPAIRTETTYRTENLGHPNSTTASGGKMGRCPVLAS